MNAVELIFADMTFERGWVFQVNRQDKTKGGSCRQVGTKLLVPPWNGAQYLHSDLFDSFLYLAAAVYTPTMRSSQLGTKLVVDHVLIVFLFFSAPYRYRPNKHPKANKWKIRERACWFWGQNGTLLTQARANVDTLWYKVLHFVWVRGWQQTHTHTIRAGWLVSCLIGMLT